MPVNLHATHYRFGIDSGTESTHGWHANEDVNPSLGTIGVDTTFLLRFTVQETGATAAANVDNQFQASRNGGAFFNITTTSTIVKAVTTAVFANAANTTKRLSGTGTFESSSQGCTTDGLSGGAQNDIAASGNSETECALQIVDADTNPGDVITFRLTSPDFTITNDVVPTVTLANPQSATPGPFALTVTTFAPTVSISDNQLVTPSPFSLTISTFAPTVTVDAGAIVVTPGPFSLAFATFAPTVAVSDNKLVVPDPFSLAITTFEPTVIVAGASMAISVTVNSVSVVQDGPISVVYTGSISGGGAGISWRDMESLDLAIAPPAVIDINSELGVVMLFMAWWKARSATLSNTALVVGKTMTVDLANNNAIRVQ